MLIGQDLGVLHRHAGGGQALDEGVGVEDRAGHGANVAPGACHSKQSPDRHARTPRLFRVQGVPRVRGPQQGPPPAA